MASWSAVQRDAPEFAERVQGIFDSRRHKTLATLRRDGSPRASGIEIAFADGEVTMGMMPGSVKLGDVRRDPRVAVHGISDDPPQGNAGAWAGDAKLSGRAVELRDAERPDEQSNRFRIDIDAVVLTRIGEPADHLVIDAWHPGAGLRRLRR